MPLPEKIRFHHLQVTDTQIILPSGKIIDLSGLDVNTRVNRRYRAVIHNQRHDEPNLNPGNRKRFIEKSNSLLDSEEQEDH